MIGLRRKLAAALMVVMMASSFNFSGLAAQNDRYWEVNENNEWNYWKDGEIVTNKMLTIREIPYYFDEEGSMASDETFEYSDNIDGKDILIKGYALPDGRVAKRYWIRLNDEGHLAANSEVGAWYYFDNNGNRIENQTKTIKEKRYCFDENGKMLTSIFNEDEGKLFYYQYDGERASDKWLKIEGDWYSFQADGSCRTASDSDAEYEFDAEGAMISGKAPCLDVDSIELSGDAERTAVIGKDLEISFDVKLATDSDAKEQKLTKNHDFRIGDMAGAELPGMNKYQKSLKIDYENNKATIVYTPITPSESKLRVIIDGVESDFVTVTSDWSQNVDKEKSDAIKDILSGTPEGITDVSSTIASIKSLCEGVSDNGSIKKTWLDKIDMLKSLDDSYAMIQRNKVSTDSKEVSSLLGTGELKLTGASMNAAPNTAIKLLAVKGEDVTLSETYEKQVSIELNLYEDDKQLSNLDVPVIVTLPIPKGMSAAGIKVYHIKADGTQEPLEIKIEGNNISLVTDSFSNFVFAGKAESSGGSNSNSSSDSGSTRNTGAQTSKIPETPGTWSQLADGKWQLKQADGTPYLNTWVYVKGGWYWLDTKGMMAEGWQDINGKRYYLNPGQGNMAIGWLQNNNSWYYFNETGAMETGWALVNGKWYYLGADGVMLTDTTTPDGYRVDSTGARTN